MDIDSHLGSRVFRRRRALGMTQSALGDLVGVRFQQIQKYECAESKISARKLWLLAAAMDVTVSYFFEGLQPDSPRKSFLQGSNLRPIGDRGQSLAAQGK